MLDTRTERFDDNEGKNARIIDPDQMAALLQWMSEYQNDLKFVVTSVPFIAEIREKESQDEPKWSGQKKPRNPANDKWNAGRFRTQRNHIIRYIYEHRIERLVFLTGDMHCCYHATMRIGTTGTKYESTVVHELAGGPVNQLQLGNEVEFDISRTGRTSDDDAGHVYEVLLDQFHTQMAAVMHVKVNYVEREQVIGARRAITPEVEWNVIRTLTDDGADAWAAPDEPSKSSAGKNQKPPDLSQPKGGEHVMKGLITFSPRRDPKILPGWVHTVARELARIDD